MSYLKFHLEEVAVDCDAAADEIFDLIAGYNAKLPPMQRFCDEFRLAAIVLRAAAEKVGYGPDE